MLILNFKKYCITILLILITEVVGIVLNLALRFCTGHVNYNWRDWGCLVQTRETSLGIWSPPIGPVWALRDQWGKFREK